MGFVVDKMALGQIFLPLLLLSPASIIQPMLHTHLHLHVGLKQGGGGTGEAWEASKRNVVWDVMLTHIFHAYLSNHGDCFLSELELFTQSHARVNRNPLRPTILFKLHIVSFARICYALRHQNVL